MQVTQYTFDYLKSLDAVLIDTKIIIQTQFIGDTISVKENSKTFSIIKDSLEKITSKCEFVNFDDAKLEGTYVRLPERRELNLDIN